MEADATDWEMYQKKEFMNRFGTTLATTDIKPADYVAIYYTGGHGVIWDFPENEALQSISRKIYEKGGFVSSGCRDVLGSLNIQLSDGTLLIKGKKVTGFSNEEKTCGIGQGRAFPDRDCISQAGGDI